MTSQFTAPPPKILVMALKGGVGKTTTCLDIARTLRDLHYRVGLLDVDIHASALPRALHLEIPTGYEPQRGGSLKPIEFDGFRIFSIGLLFPERTANMWDGPTKAEAVRQIATSSIDWGTDLDYLVVDTPPTSGDEIQSLLRNLTNIYSAVIVCQPNDLALLALAKTLDVLTETGTPVAGVLANMAGFECPRCHTVSQLFDRNQGDIINFCQDVRVPYLGAIPLASQQERLRRMRPIVTDLLKVHPVTLEKHQGGLARWLMAKILT